MQWGEKYRQSILKYTANVCELLKAKWTNDSKCFRPYQKSASCECGRMAQRSANKFWNETIDEIKIETPRMGFGQNAKKARLQHECILVFRHGI